MRRLKPRRTRKRVFFDALKDLIAFFEKKDVGEDDDDVLLEDDDTDFVCW